MGNMQAAYRGGLAVCWASGVAANGPRLCFVCLAPALDRIYSVFDVCRGPCLVCGSLLQAPRGNMEGEGLRLHVIGVGAWAVSQPH